MQQIEYLFVEAITLHKQGKLNQAKVLYEEVLKKNETHFDSLFLLGLLAIQSKNAELAVNYFGKAVAINPQHAEALNNYGNSLQDTNKWDEALVCYEKAIKINQEYALAYFNRGNAMKLLGRIDEALKSYEKAIELDSNYAEAYLHRGNLLLELQKYNNSIENFDKSIEINPNIAQAYSNRGNALQKLRKYTDAIESYNRAISICPDLAEAYSNKGNALVEIRKYDQAILNYKKALSLNPNIEYLLGSLINASLYICDWENFVENKNKLILQIKAGRKVTPPFQLQSIVDDAELQLITTKIWMNSNFNYQKLINTKISTRTGGKIRIGYFSGDFSQHPVSFLTAGLFETHDRNRFELIAFDYGEDDRSKIRNRITSAFEMFNCVSEFTDSEIATLANKLNINIAIDLSGLTQNGRPGIFYHRAAPVQISYLGYLGTMGSSAYDYIFADKVLIPESLQKNYHEKIIYLPNYQINDYRKLNTNNKKEAIEINLPKNNFVYCCFNNTYKISPMIFGAWMKILKEVPKSVLLLYVDNNFAQKNLEKEAEKRGVSKDRLVFCGHIAREKYLERFQIADLFLDTAPYNAGTTASDALWCGLPVLTYKGTSFASRMAASLLTSLEMTELITLKIEDYENKAIELAQYPAKMKKIKEQLEISKVTSPLFDKKIITKTIEEAYVKVWESKIAGNSVRNIY